MTIPPPSLQLYYPRAEFRVFGAGLIARAKAFLEENGIAVRSVEYMPCERYIVSDKSHSANIKIRDGLLKIKVQTGMTSEGYEIYRPKAKWQFPLKKTELVELLEHLMVQDPELLADQSEYSQEALLSFVRNHPRLSVVEVAKTRYAFMIGEVICEYASVTINGEETETVSCEAEKTESVQAVVHKMRLSEFSNTNYLVAIKAVLRKSRAHF